MRVAMIAAAFALLSSLVLIGEAEHPKQPKRDADGWVVPHEVNDRPGSACQSGAFAAYNGCRQELDDQWYDGGSVEEPKVQRAKDYARCERVEHDAFNACNQYGKD